MKTFVWMLAVYCLLAGAAAHSSSLDEWMLLEQTRLSRDVDNSKIVAPDVQNQTTKYRPENQKWFPLKAIWISDSELHVAENPTDGDGVARSLKRATAHFMCLSGFRKINAELEAAR